MDLSVVPYKHHHHHHQSTKAENESEDGDVVEPKSAADKNGHKHSNPNKKVKYRECMRNHAASLGGHANDGCGEFMPAEDAGDFLSCAACGCHRNFHRRELLLGGVPYSPPPPPPQPMALLYNAGPVTPRWDPKMVVGPGIGPRRHRNGGARDGHDEGSEREYDRRSSETPEREDHVPAQAAGSAASGGTGGSGKRFRTKFTSEQKDRMLEFAERIGWRIQRQDEAAINQFCSQIGVKRNVLKVWMHNNKNAYRRREPPPTPSSALQEAPPLHPTHTAPPPQQPVVGV